MQNGQKFVLWIHERTSSDNVRSWMKITSRRPVPVTAVRIVNLGLSHVRETGISNIATIVPAPWVQPVKRKVMEKGKMSL